jgi:lipopolysaccharide export system permease protein
MRLLQKYLLGELIRVFVFVVSVLTVLLVFVGAFGQISENNLGPAQLLEILPYLVPSMLPYTIPATMLLTVTVVYGRVAADHEVTAAKAAGISAMSLLWPSFLMAALLSVVSLLLTDQVIPWALTNIESKVARMAESIFLDILHTQKVLIYRDPSLQVSVDDVDGKRLIRPLFRYTPRGGATMNVAAAEATIHFDLDKRLVQVNLQKFDVEVPNRQNFHNSKDQEFSFPMPPVPARLKAMNCSIHELRKNLTTMESNLDKHRSERDLETAFALATGDFERLHAPEVLQYDIDLQNNQEDISRIYTDIHKRFALSASCFFFAFLGAPFSVLQARRQVLTSFFMCFLPILILYYPIALLMMDQSKSGAVNPAWAMWTGNAVLTPIALVTLRKVLKH